MNIIDLVKQWLIDHEHYEDEPSFHNDLKSLCNLIEEAISQAEYHRKYGDTLPYDDNFGDNKLCLCGHPYYRHFDTYNNMAPVGCKYCYNYAEKDCPHYGDYHCVGGFKEKIECNCGKCKSCMGM